MAYRRDRPMLEKGFGECCPEYQAPIYADDSMPFKIYSDPVAYSWPNDPYAKGSYSYIAAGQENIMTDSKAEQGEFVKELFAPVEASLYFVGEHASTLLDAAGTMEAACESGERIARMIHDKQNRLRRQDKEKDKGQ